MNQLIDKKVGLLELLSTADKSTIVGAINEVDGKLSELNPTNFMISNLGNYDTVLEWASNNGNTMTFYTSAKSYPDLPRGFAWGHLWVAGKNIYDTGGTVFVRDNASDEIYVRGFTGSDTEADPLRWVSEWELLVTDKKLFELVSNPSIIINPDFKINQRGQIKYIGEDSSKVIYTVDRWSMYNNCDVTVTENGVHVDFKNKSSSFGTYIENYKDFTGKPITVSWESSNVTNDYLVCAVVAYNSSGAAILNSWTYITNLKLTVDNIPIGTEKLLIRFKINGGVAAAASTGSLDLKFVKAEIGNNATVFVPPNPAEELIKCKRYYQRINGNGITVAKKIVDKNFVCYTRFTTEMRTTPTIHTIGTVRLYLPETNQVLTSSDSNWIEDCNLSNTGIQWLMIRTSLFTNVPDIVGYVGYIDNSEDILESDAEIY